MNFFYSYNEVDLRFIYKSTLKRIEFLKNIKFNDNCIKPKLKLCIKFNNIIEPDLVKIYDYVCFLWLLSGGRIPYLKKLNNSLIKGVRYYRFVLYTIIYDNFKYYKFLEFLHYSIINYVGKDNVKIFSNGISNFHILLSNVVGFSNIKIFNSFYFIGVKNDIEVLFFKKRRFNISYYFFSVKFFLSLFKINERIKL